MKLVGIVGTNASFSYNRILLQFMQKHFSDQATIELIEIKDIPVFKMDTERKGPAEVRDLVEKIESADGVIISTPEYNHTIPAPLKNVLEWLSYVSTALQDKPVMITGAAYGTLGSSRAQGHLRQILHAPELRALVLQGKEFLLGEVMNAFDDEGNLKDPKKLAELEAYFADFLTFIEVAQEFAKKRASKA